MYQKRYKPSSRIKRRSKTRHYFNIFIKIGLPTVVFIGFIFLTRADFLQVKSFEVVGTKTIQPEEIKNVANGFISGSRFFLMPKSNIFLVDKDKLIANLLSSFNRLEQVEMNKRFFAKTVELKVIERQADLLWCSQDESCFLMSKDGLVFAEAQKKEVSDLIIFRGNIIDNPLFKNFASKEQMFNYLKAIEILRGAKLEVSEINVESKDKAIFKTDIGSIFLNPEEDLALSTPNAVILINDVKSKNSSAQFDYIDARFGNKVFYRVK